MVVVLALCVWLTVDELQIDNQRHLRADAVYRHDASSRARAGVRGGSWGMCSPGCRSRCDRTQASGRSTARRRRARRPPQPARAPPLPHLHQDRAGVGASRDAMRGVRPRKHCESLASLRSAFRMQWAAEPPVCELACMRAWEGGRAQACVCTCACARGGRAADLAKPLCAQRLDHVEDSLQHGHVQIAEILSAAHTRHRTKAFSFQPCSLLVSSHARKDHGGS